jgi:four helix bundle protein
MGAVRSYRDLVAWQRGVELVETTYRLTEHFPQREIYCLARALRASAVSIPSNIAEGQGRRSTREFLHHLSIAHGSLCELETQLLIAERLGYIEREDGESIIGVAAEVGRLVNGLYNSLNIER